MQAVVSLGSNIEPRADCLARALAALAALPGTRLERASEPEETEPVGVPPEYAHLDALGRKRTVRNGPRTIDLDLVDFGGMVLDEPDLVLPHPRARERAFVMDPWRRLCPQSADLV